GSELMVGAFGDVIPRAYQGLKLRERRVDLPGHRRLLGLFSDDFARQLLELAQRGRGELKDLDLALELGLEARERDRVLGVKVGREVDLLRLDGVIEQLPQVDRERVVRLSVEAEFGHRAGLVPARIV